MHAMSWTLDLCHAPCTPSLVAMHCREQLQQKEAQRAQLAQQLRRAQKTANLMRRKFEATPGGAAARELPLPPTSPGFSEMEATSAPMASEVGLCSLDKGTKNTCLQWACRREVQQHKANQCDSLLTLDGQCWHS